jgi:hypothetical protein
VPLLVVQVLTGWQVWERTHIVLEYDHRARSFSRVATAELRSRFHPAHMVGHKAPDLPPASCKVCTPLNYFSTLTRPCHPTTAYLASIHRPPVVRLQLFRVHRLVSQAVPLLGHFAQCSFAKGPCMGGWLQHEPEAVVGEGRAPEVEAPDAVPAKVSDWHRPTTTMAI